MQEDKSYKDDRRHKDDCYEDDWRHKDDCYEDDDRDKRRKRRRRELERLNDDNTRTYTPWLVIRYALNDLGLRPLPGGATHWLSPDIWIESSDPVGRAVAGKHNFVHARVFNLGKAMSAPTRVDFYWADPSVGLGAQHMNLIGTEWVQIDPHTARDVRCNTPWIPVFLNSGHECLKVNCTNMILDPIQFPFQPRVDRHVGQRNITVIEGGVGEELEFSLGVNNLLALPVQMELMAHVEHVRVDQKLMEMLSARELTPRVAAFGQMPRLTAQELLGRFTPEAKDYNRAVRMARYLGTGHGEALRIDAGIERVGAHQRSAICLETSWAQHRCQVAPTRDPNGILASLQAKAVLAEDSTSGQLHRGFRLAAAEFDAFERRGLDLQIRLPGTMRQGDFIVVHLGQWIAGVLIGGYTILVENLP